MASYQQLIIVTLCIFFVYMSFIQVDQDFAVETDAIVHNTGEDIMGETGENTVPLSNTTRDLRPLLIQKIDNSAGEDYFPLLKRFHTYSSQSHYEWSLSEDMLSYALKQFHSFIPDAELENSIVKNNPIPSNVPPSAPLDDLLRGVLEENHKYSQMQEDKLLQKMQQKVLNVLGPLSKI